MKAEAIRALEQFRQMHLASNGQADTVSESPELLKVNPSRVPKKINYPDHVKPLKERIMSALKGGCRTPDSVATYCKEEVKLITLQLGRWVSRGLIGKHTNPDSGVTRYYPHDIAKEKGYLIAPQPIKRKKKAKEVKVSTYVATVLPEDQQPRRKFVSPRSLQMADDMLGIRNNLATAEHLMQYEALKKHCAFLENQVRGWQVEARKQASEINKLQDALINARKTRDVTSEVTEVMKEVTQLRATVAYLESKLFGGK